MLNQRLLTLALWLPFAYFSYYFSFTFNVGDQSASLSCLSIFLPLIACPLASAASLPLVGAIWFILHLVHPIPLTAGIPTMLATLSWHLSGQGEKANRSFHILFPVAAILMFIASKAGGGAWPYTLYWLIPVACSFMTPTVVVRAFQSTFIAHATGSVIWVYLVPLASEQWLALIPAVAVERLISASVAVAAIGAFAFMEKAVFSAFIKSRRAAA